VELLKTAKHGAGERVFVIDFHYDGKASARAKPATGVASVEDLAKLAERLEALDRRSRIGPWTQATLRAIEARPAVLAAKLARSLGRPRDEFKRDVRKLKNLGLTFSLEIGYRLTPKGEALLARQ
jgi:predicted transcriptional regulator